MQLHLKNTRKLTLYRRNSNQTVSVWTIIQRGRLLIRRWGIENGKIQTTRQKHGPIQNRSAIKVCQQAFDRAVLLRKEGGFVEKLTEVRQTNEVVAKDMDFLTLPKSFAPQKPIQAPPAKDCTKKRIILRKRDGQRHYVLVQPDGDIVLYSCKMKDVTAKFPLTVRALQDLNIPPCTVLDGEIICDRDGKDDFRSTNKVCRALPEEAAKNEAALPIRYMVFDVLYYDGIPVWNAPYKERREYMNAGCIPSEHGRIFQPFRWLSMSKAEHAVKSKGWEGLVLWDADAPNNLRMDGKFARHGCNKWKPIKEGDFVALGWLPGSGANSEVVGKLRIAEYRKTPLDPKPLLYAIGRVGSGFTKPQRTEAMTWKYPCVVQLEYNLQQPDTRALREPVFIRKRDDKTLKDLWIDCRVASKA